MPTLPKALTPLSDYLTAIFPGLHPVELVVVMEGGQEVRLPLTTAAGLVPVSPEEQVPFAPSVFQLAALRAMIGRAFMVDVLAQYMMTGTDLLTETRRRLYGRKGLRQLQDHGLVKLHPKMGFYRPDAPPHDLYAMPGHPLR